MDWYAETFRATVVLVAASGLVAAPALVGVGGSLALVVLALGVSGGLYTARDALASAPTVVRHDIGYYGRALWVSGLVAGLVFLLGLGTTPGELLALGGLVGLVGMANYFLRPLYRVVAALGRAFVGSTT